MSRTILIPLLILTLSGISDLSIAQDSILNGYILEGFDNNLALKQKELDYRRSVQSLNQAKALFYPNISFNARFSVAEGGRTIDFPVGDLLNPIYSTLNQLTQSQQFPQIDNQQIYFLRPTEQETMLSLRQPLFHSDIWFNYKIRKEISDAVNIGIDVYRRELVSEIKVAYYNYMKTVHALVLFEQTLNVVTENLRVSQSLFDNDKVTADAVYRSQAELSKVERQMAEAEKFNESARAYFNFLLNRTLKSIIEVNNSNIKIDSLLLNTDSSFTIANKNREELWQLQDYLQASEYNVKLNKFNHAPTISLGVDYGIQGETYQFNEKSDFLFASVVMRWKIFHGMETKAKIQQASIDQDILKNQYEDAQNQIHLQVIDASYEVTASEKAVVSARAQSRSATKAFEIIRKKYNLGQTSLLEFTNARTDMTNAGLNLILSSYDYEISLAELERAMGTYPLNN